MYPKIVGWLPALALIPLLGALLNGLLGRRLGRTFVTVVGVGAPAVAFALGAAAFSVSLLHDRQVVAAGSRAAVSRAEQMLAGQRTAAGEVIAPVLHDDPRRLDPVPQDRVFLRLPEVSFERDRPLLVEVARATGVDIGPSENFGALSYQADLGSWIAFGGLDVRFKFVLDRLAMIMVLVITGVGTLIHIYSSRYMEHEDAGGFARYFCYLNMFVGAMLILVLGGDLLLLFVGWEGVGLCSYLLIGFHYKDSANAACGSKAFIVNRIGDLGFVLGLLLLMTLVRDATPGVAFSADIERLNLLASTNALAPDTGVLGIACLLLFLGATGKSAQIPLHLWLPDAMAGPTPVSALIHAATMVTAGVYMIARLSPVFADAAVGGVPVLGVIAIVGVATAFFAGTAALGQDDIKRVLAYSTVSQLGYMFVAVGAAAYGAAVFHLVTHAFFKALLFLASGSVIHATGTQSMREMGGLRRYMPITFVTMTIGALALSAFPFVVSGFYSKDLILAEVFLRGHTEGASQVWYGIYAVGVLTGAITALYSARMIMLTFFGEYRGGGHPHESPQAMTIPLVLLAVLSVFAAAFGLPEIMTHTEPGLPHYLAAVVATVERTVTPEMHHQIELIGMAIGSVAALLGIAGGVYIWRTPDNPWELPRPGGVIEKTRGLLANAWLYDEVVNKSGLQPATKYLSHVLWRWVDDEAIDRGLVDGAGRVGAELSHFTRSFQVGRVARYAGYFTIGALLIPLVALVLVPAWPQLLTLLSRGAAAGH
ncbi:MAG: NADH-quinone oxidoreductase subunit L [Planctomycetes bacterium]|nr:NADH-quinone oxidoreductase subunit L [Planctomycetota bacterium]